MNGRTLLIWFQQTITFFLRRSRSVNLSVFVRGSVTVSISISLGQLKCFFVQISTHPAVNAVNPNREHMGRLLEQPRLFIQETIATEQRASQLWHKINESNKYQDGVLYTLCLVYVLVAAVVLVQIIRIQLRVSERGWTTQKVFHLMNFTVGVLRAVIFGFHKYLFAFEPRFLAVRVLMDLPGMLHLSTYTFLVLCWARIYHQAQYSSFTENLVPAYCIINGAMYFIQVCIWICMWIHDNSVVQAMARYFAAFTSICAAMAFLIYGGMLVLMLRRYPLCEFRRNRKMLSEVCSVTVICCTCFAIRCYVVANGQSLDVTKHPIANLFYYLWVEILPSGLVLFILRALPLKRRPSQCRPLLSDA